MKFNLDSLVRPDLCDLESYASARGENSEEVGMTLLDANESPYGNGYNRYPDPQQTVLKKVLAAQKEVFQNQIILGNGSDELLDLLIRCFCVPGRDNVITLPPTFGMYKVLAKINAVQVREVSLDENFQPKVKDILETMDDRTKILFLCSPNNPTGNSLSEERIRQLLEKFSGLVIIDEAYVDFTGKSWLNSLEKYPNLIVLQTFSKAYGLAGIRLGAVLASVEVIALLQKIKLPYNVNVLTQQIALERLQQQESLQGEIKIILQQRSLMKAELERLEFVEKIYPSDGNFLLLKVDDAEKRYRQFLKEGFVLRNRSGDLNCENTLRITIGTPEENSRLLEVARKWKSGKVEI